jgi:WD40 repeat protein
VNHLTINTEGDEDEDDEDDEKPQKKKKTTTPRVNKKKQTPSKKQAAPAAVTPKSQSRKKVTSKFKYTGSVVHPDAISAVVYNHSHADYTDTLAVIGKHYVTIYKAVEVGKNHPSGLRLMKTFFDEDDEFTTGAWGVDLNGDPIIAVGCKSGVIKTWNFSWRSVKKDRFRMMRLPGHGGAVNEICFHPVKRELLISGSDDNSIRLWDLTLGRTVAIFSDRFPVLSVDFNVTGTSFVSSSADGIKIWATDDNSRALEYLNFLRNKQRAEYRAKRKTSGKGKTPIKDEASTPGSRRSVRRPSNVSRTDFYYFYSSDEESGSLPSQQQPDFNNVPVQSVSTIVEPTFATTKVHSGTVDCVRYYGDLILSRAAKQDAEPGNRVVLWAPNSLIYSNENVAVVREKAETDKEFTTVHVFTLSKEGAEKEVKMSLDSTMTQLAGTFIFNKTNFIVPVADGTLDVFDLQQLEEEKHDTVTPRKRGRSSAPVVEKIPKRVSKQFQTLEEKDITGLVSSVSFSYDQKSLVYGGENNTLWKFDRS